MKYRHYKVNTNARSTSNRSMEFALNKINANKEKIIEIIKVNDNYIEIITLGQDNE